jgi:CRP/FNR family cyclic AMP-dependent transcriptional regulator
MNEQEITKFLKIVPIFKDLNNRQIGSLAKLAYEREYQAGDTIVSQGEGGIGLFVVVSGTAEAILKHPDGETNVVNTFGPTNFFGELALLDDGPRTASVVAKEATRCLGILRWDFLTMLKHDADMAVTILLEVAHRFRQLLATM